MTEDEKAKATSEIFAFIGRYVIVFQWIEAKVEEGILLLWGHSNWSSSKNRLSQMTNSQKIDALWKAFQEAPENSRGRSRAEWVGHFEAIIGRLHTERDRRNRLLHSHYLFEFLELGDPVMQIDPKGKEADRTSSLSGVAQEAITSQLVDLAMEMNFAHLQLVHDYNAPELKEQERDMDATWGLTRPAKQGLQ